MIDFTLLASWTGALSLLGLVATGYGLIARTVPDPAHLQLCAGAVFGAFALAFMGMPLPVAAGVNLDPRIVPVALAAACLGLRGGAVTLLMAIGMRLWIGGTGTGAGIAAILFSAIAGFAWNQRTWPDARPAGEYVRLALTVSLGLWTIVLLPTPVAVGVLSNAIPLAMLCMISVPLTAFLLDRALALPLGSRGRTDP